jgi:hypothetical protein
MSSNMEKLQHKLKYRVIIGEYQVSIKIQTCIRCKLPAMVLSCTSYGTGLCYPCISECFAKAPTIPIDQHIMLLEEENAKVESEVTKLNQEKEKKEGYSNHLKRKMCDLEQQQKTK